MPVYPKAAPPCVQPTPQASDCAALDTDGTSRARRTPEHWSQSVDARRMAPRVALPYDDRRGRAGILFLRQDTDLGSVGDENVRVLAFQIHLYQVASGIRIRSLLKRGGVPRSWGARSVASMQ